VKTRHHFAQLCRPIHDTDLYDLSIVFFAVFDALFAAIRCY